MENSIKAERKDSLQNLLRSYKNIPDFELEGGPFEKLVFSFFLDNSSIDLKLNNEGTERIESLINKKNIIMKIFQRETTDRRGRKIQEIPFSLTENLGDEDLIIHRPYDKTYPNVDGMLEFLDSNNKRTLVFLQMSLDGPTKHTRGKESRERFFEEKDSEYLALDVNWRSVTISELKNINDAAIKKFKKENPEKVEEVRQFVEKKWPRKDSSIIKTKIKSRIKKNIRQNQMALRRERLEQMKADHHLLETCEKYLVWVVPKIGSLKHYQLDEGVEGNLQPDEGVKGNLMYKNQSLMEISSIYNTFKDSLKIK